MKLLEIAIGVLFIVVGLYSLIYPQRMKRSTASTQTQPWVALVLGPLFVILGIGAIVAGLRSP